MQENFRPDNPVPVPIPDSEMQEAFDKVSNEQLRTILENGLFYISYAISRSLNAADHRQAAEIDRRLYGLRLTLIDLASLAQLVLPATEFTRFEKNAIAGSLNQAFEEDGSIANRIIARHYDDPNRTVPYSRSAPDAGHLLAIAGYLRSRIPAA